MKENVFPIVLLIAAVFGAVMIFGASRGEHALVGKPAPEIRLATLDGGEFVLSEHRGERIVLLDFWATWCGPCRTSMPAVAAIAEEFADQDVVLYTVNQNESPATVQHFLDELEDFHDGGIAFPPGHIGTVILFSIFQVHAEDAFVILLDKGNGGLAGSGYIVSDIQIDAQVFPVRQHFPVVGGGCNLGVIVKCDDDFVFICERSESSCGVSGEFASDAFCPERLGRFEHRPVCFFARLLCVARFEGDGFLALDREAATSADHRAEADRSGFPLLPLAR